LIDTLLQDPVAMDAPPIVSPESPPTPAIMGKIAAVEHSMWPGVPLVPTMATGFSDDRQTRNARIPSYDVSGVWIDVDENRAHGRDERIGVQAFDESVEFTYRLIKAMGAARVGVVVASPSRYAGGRRYVNCQWAAPDYVGRLPPTPARPARRYRKRPA
jgi:hypothetical protein